MSSNSNNNSNNKSNNSKKKRIEHWYVIAVALMAFDVLATHTAYFFALWLRFDGKYSLIPTQYLNGYVCTISIYAVASIAIFWFFRMYRIVWRYISYPEVFRCAIKGMTSSAI